MRKKEGFRANTARKSLSENSKAHLWIRKWEEISGLHSVTASEWGSWVALHTEAPASGGTPPSQPTCASTPEAPSFLPQKNCSQMEPTLTGLSGRCIQKKTLPRAA